MPMPRLVIRIPLDELWDDSGPLIAERVRCLSKLDLRELVRLGAVTFYVAEGGGPLRRVEPAECFDFWKSEIEPHLVDPPEKRIYLDDYPDGYAYVASEWKTNDGTSVVLLEMYH